MSKIARLQTQIEALQLELARVSSLPEDDFDNHAVIMFEKQYVGQGRSYTYVALKAGAKWYMTGRNRGLFAMTWEELTDFIGDFDAADVWYATEWERV